MNVRRLLPCTALAATALYAAVNLIALQVIAQPTGRLDPWFEEPWSDWYFPALITVCVLAFIGMVAWMTVPGPRGPSPM